MNTTITESGQMAYESAYLIGAVLLLMFMGMAVIGVLAYFWLKKGKYKKEKITLNI